MIIPGLAVAALDYLFLDPGPFHRVAFREPFNGGNFFALDLFYRDGAGPFWPGRQ